MKKFLAISILALSILSVLPVIGCGGQPGTVPVVSTPAPTPTPTPAPPVLAPNFTLSASVSGTETPQGNDTAVMTGSLSAAAQNGFNAPISVTISGLPNGVTLASGRSADGSISLQAGVGSSLTFVVAYYTVPGSYVLTFTGTSGTLAPVTTTATVVVTEPAGGVLPAPGMFSMVPATNPVIVCNVSTDIFNGDTVCYANATGTSPGPPTTVPLQTALVLTFSPPSGCSGSATVYFSMPVNNVGILEFDPSTDSQADVTWLPMILQPNVPQTVYIGLNGYGQAPDGTYTVSATAQDCGGTGQYQSFQLNVIGTAVAN
jgi:hypothetical protein